LLGFVEVVPNSRVNFEFVDGFFVDAANICNRLYLFDRKTTASSRVATTFVNFLGFFFISKFAPVRVFFFLRANTKARDVCVVCDNNGACHKVQ